MPQIQVKVKSQHLRGNSYTHGRRNMHRMCPLYEALRDSGYSNSIVFNDEVMLASGGQRYYIIPEQWNKALVEKLIVEVDKGDEKEIEITLSTDRVIL